MFFFKHLNYLRAFHVTLGLFSYFMVLERELIHELISILEVGTASTRLLYFFIDLIAN